ncbi:MAG: geranylgeranyl reductase family protein [Desulfobacterales bacterium]|nr:geranylgeranyl reductase family protein [Desulfobacterales bacterium]
MHALDEKVNWQSDIQSIPDQLWDVVIIGAGPAGATAACHLAAAHYKVLLLDRKKFPREKVCGDGLLPDSLRCLDAIGIGRKIRSHSHQESTCSIFSPSRNKVDIPGEFLTIKRSILDTIIAQNAVERGAVFAFGEANWLATESDGGVTFTIQGSDRRYRARIGMLATGVNVRLFRHLKWSVQKRPSAVALRCYVRSTYPIDRLIVSYDKSIVPGYGWIFPLKDNEYNVGCGIRLHYVQKGNINLKKAFYKFVDAFPLARELMRQSDHRTALQAAALRCDFEGAHPYVNGPVVAVGETIGTTLPYLGEGIGKAIESSQMAAAAVSAALASEDLSKLNQYSQNVKSKLKPRYRGYRMAEKRLSRPWLNNFIIGRFGTSTYAQEMLAGMIAETKNPQDIFSLKGIVNTFFK